MNGNNAAQHSRALFSDNEQDYAVFAATTTEKQETAHRVVNYARANALSSKAALNITDLGMGDANSVVSLANIIAPNPDQDVNILAKETDPALILLAIEHMAERLANYPKTIISLSNGPNAKILNCDLGKREQVIVESLDFAEMVDELHEKLPSLLKAHWKIAKKAGGHARGFYYNTTLDIHHAHRADEEAPYYDEGFDIALAFQAGNIATKAPKRAKNTMTPALWALKLGGRYFATQANLTNPLYEAFSKAEIEIAAFKASLEDVFEASCQQLERMEGGAQGFKSLDTIEFDYEVLHKDGLSDDAYLHSVFTAMAYHAQIRGYSSDQQSQAIKVLRETVGNETVRLNNQLLIVGHH